jgi:hypothetical protein
VIDSDVVPRHVEGKFGVSWHVDMADDLFDDMASLTFIHLGFSNVARFPSFDGLKNLKSLAVACHLNLEELPSFRGLGSLERLVLTCMPVLKAIPDMSPLMNLQAFGTSDRGSFCCNGFARVCDLAHSMCTTDLVWGSPPVMCLPPDLLATPATRRMFNKFSASVCADQALLPDQLKPGPAPEGAAQCNGTMYRQCSAFGDDHAMCYNPRLIGITCNNNPFAIAMRRRQIAEGVGEPCNPEFEAWLGCEGQHAGR